MTAVNEDRKQTAYAVSVDARDVEATGISAADRAHTIKVLSDSATEPGDLTRPGHVMPLRAVPGGVLRRAGHTEAAVDLARLAGLSPSGALCELVNEDGTMMRAPQCRAFADEHGLVMISIADLIRYRRGHERQVERVATTTLPTAFGDFTAVGYRCALDDIEHVALVVGDIGDGQDILVRVHSECLTGDVFGSLRCDCGPQLQAAMRAVAEEGRGVVLYMRGHEGRGIGLVSQAAGLRAAGRRARHRRRQPRPRPAGRRPRLRHRRADPGRPRRAHHAPADQQPGQARGPGGLRPDDRRARAAGDRAQPVQRRLPGDQARADGPHGRTPMSGAGAPSVEINGEGLRVAIVAASWHDTVMDGLVAGARRPAPTPGPSTSSTGSRGPSSCPWSPRSRPTRGSTPSWPSA